MSLLIRSPLLRAGFIAASLGAVVAAAITSTAGWLVIAVLLLVPIATSLSQAGRLAASLQGWKRQTIDAFVWGVPLRGHGAAGLRVASVGALGAGLLIHLIDAEEGTTLLKVAQPRSWLVENARIVIDEAAYVQWAGRKLVRTEGCPAVAISSSASDAV